MSQEKRKTLGPICVRSQGLGDPFFEVRLMSQKVLIKPFEAIDQLNLIHSAYSLSTVNGRRILGGKVQMNNGGAHVPLIVRWPGVVAPKRTCADLIDFSDVLPTLA